MEETIPSGIKSNEDLVKLADPFAQLINRMQLEEGEAVHDVVSGGLYAMGSALAQIGIHIDVNGAISQMVPPLAMGYSTCIEAVKKKMI